MLMALASAFILRSESRWTHDHILLSKCIENTATNSSIITSRSCRTDHVENTASQLVH
jgi:hypothetical protein